MLGNFENPTFNQGTNPEKVDPEKFEGGGETKKGIEVEGG